MGSCGHLSEEWSKKVYITNNTRLYGLNKDLEQEGNEQKLEGASCFGSNVNK